MKKYLKLVLSLIMVFALTGCLKYNVNMEVKDDKSVSLEFIYAMNTSYADQFNNMTNSIDEEEDEDLEVTGIEEDDELEFDFDEEEEETTGEDIDKEEFEWLEKKGYKVEDYKYEDKEGNKYEGVKISKTFDSIDDITKDDEKTIDFNALFQDKDKFDDSQFFSKKGSVYKANFVFDFTQDGQDVSEQYKDYAKMFDMTYEIKLPKKAKSNNATKESDDGKTLTWNLTYGKKNTIEYEFELGSKKTIFIIAGVVVAVAVIACVLVVVLKKKPTEPAAPAAPTENLTSGN